MKYRLGWLEYWSSKREAFDERVITLFHQESDGWYEHERILYFVAKDDKKAIEYITEYLKDTKDDIDVFSLSKEINKGEYEVIFTEEELAL